MTLSADSFIEPDNKDWTWILTDQCPDCRYDAKSLDHSHVGKILTEIAQCWTTALGSDDVVTRKVTNKWSDLEYGCHVRDAYVVFKTRFELVLSKPNPQFANWDQDEAAAQGNYNGQNPQLVAAEITKLSNEIAVLLANLTPDQLALPCTRSNGSDFTLGTLIGYFLHDPIHHLSDVGAPNS